MALIPEPRGPEITSPDAGYFTRQDRTGGISDKVAGPCTTSTPMRSAVCDDFKKRWERGDAPRIEEYLDQLNPSDESAAISLILEDYRLAESAGQNPDRDEYLAASPRMATALREYSNWANCLASWIRGRSTRPRRATRSVLTCCGASRARGLRAVFLAEQCDLENRLVILKLSTRPTREPWLLARAGHSHIVEILSHAMVDDGAFQLICMPFLGARPSRPSSIIAAGSASLVARVAICSRTSTPSPPPSTPASIRRVRREILNSLTDCQAMAWITARLADALDHAQCRDVIHGDVKPSNILLTADSNPMLLDFNLARNWSFDKTNGPLEDPRGTLAYMAPERLGAIASLGSTALDTWRSSEVEPSEGDDPHRADIYSLGIVLLEALTAASPAAAMPDRDAPVCTPKTMPDLAAEYGSFRERGALAVIRASESAAGQTIPPALRNSRALPGRPPRRPIPAGARAGRGSGPLAGRPAAGLRRRAILVSDPAPLCAAEQEAALRRGTGTGDVPGHDVPGGEPDPVALDAQGHGHVQAGPELG